MSSNLPPFPVDDVALDALEHALGYTLTINEDGDPVSSARLVHDKALSVEGGWWDGESSNLG